MTMTSGTSRMPAITALAWTAAHHDKTQSDAEKKAPQFCD